MHHRLPGQEESDDCEECRDSEEGEFLSPALDGIHGPRPGHGVRGNCGQAEEQKGGANEHKRERQHAGHSRFRFEWRQGRRRAAPAFQCCARGFTRSGGALSVDAVGASAGYRLGMSGGALSALTSSTNLRRGCEPCGRSIIHACCRGSRRRSWGNRRRSGLRHGWRRRSRSLARRRGWWWFRRRIRSEPGCRRARSEGENRRDQAKQNLAKRSRTAATNLQTHRPHMMAPIGSFLQA
jgi:hypothetical protein